MWFTPIFGLPVEHPVTDQPGITLSGGQFGTDPILAERVETALSGVQTDLEERVAELETSITDLGAVATQTIAEFHGGDGTNVTTVATGLDQTFRNIAVLWRGGGDTANTLVSLGMRFNGVAGSSDYHSFRGYAHNNAWTVASQLDSTALHVGVVGRQAGTHGVIWIPVYSDVGSIKGAHGSALARGVNSLSSQVAWGMGGGWFGGTTDAITSIQIWPVGTTWFGNVDVRVIGYM